MLDRTTRTLAALACAVATGLAPAAALGHGGATLAEGGGKGVTIVVQGTDSATGGGKPAADVSTILGGPGTGEGSKVVYYVRPEHAETFRVEADRDAGGTHHADVALAGRGDWRTWDVTAIVTLNTGKRLRVTNAASNPPGPETAQPSKPAAPTTPGAADTPATTPPQPRVESPEASAKPATATEVPVEDISGEDDGAPAWVLPSIAVVLIAGLLGLALTRRGRSGNDAGDDWDGGGA